MHMSNLRIVTSLITALALLPVAALASGGGGGASAPAAPLGSPQQEVKSPEQLAVDHYNAGLRLRDKAWKAEEKAKGLSGDQSKKQLAKAQQHYKKAIVQFKMATANDRGMHQAWSSLGYALRRTGEWDKSIEAYDTALALDPNYTEAIEYRAEAHLALGRFDEVKDAYMFLFQNDREKADELLEAMKSWVAEHRRDPGDHSQEDVEGFASWVDERADLAAQTASLHRPGTKSWGAGR